MAEKERVFPWYQAAASLFNKHQGKTIFAVVFQHFGLDADDKNAREGVWSFWGECGGHVYCFPGTHGNEETLSPAQEFEQNVTMIREEPVEFLRGFSEPIDLLHLDGWPIGTEGYQRRHLSIYDAARPHFHDGTIILIGDSGRDHGGKSALILPRALDDGFQVLLWGSLTLLAHVRPSDVRNIVPRVGPPVPADASFDDAIRLHREGSTWEAEQLYRGVLRQWPEHVGATHLLGVVRHQRADHNEALRLIGKAIAMDPTQAVFFNNYGAALQSLGRYVEAMVCFHRALQLQPAYVDALSNLGLAQDCLGQEEAAASAFRRCFQLQPHHPDSVKRLGDLLQRQGKDAQAIELYREAIAEKPLPDLCFHLGALLSNAGRNDLAATELQKVIDQQPDFAEAWFNKGVTYQAERMVPEARECFGRAVQLCPERRLWRLREATLGPLVFRNKEEIDDYRGQLDRALDDWLAAPPPSASWNELLFSDPLPIFNLAYHGENNLQLKRKIAAVFEPYFRELPEPSSSELVGRRRIGVVVTRRHEGIFLRCMKGILQSLSRKDFELVVFCSGGSLELIRNELARDDIRFVALPWSLPEAVQRARAAACDLIYFWEVGSDSLNYLLPHARLAPVQCTSHGSLGTTGILSMDYFVSSELIETEAAADHYSEKLWKSKTFLMNQSRLSPVSPVSRDYFRLPVDHNLYMCFQNPLKLHPDMDGLLNGILSRDPKGIVVLLGGRQERVVSLLRQRFAETIPDACQRIVLLPWLKFEDYCRLLQLADAVLDPPHYTAGSSLYDLFSFHQPIVTIPGQLAVSRVTAAYYEKMGIRELIARSPDEYIALAVRLAGDRDYRMCLRDRIRLATNAIFDDQEAPREHERFFREALG